MRSSPRSRQDDHSKLKARPDMLSESKGGYRVLTGVQVARWAGHIVSIGGRPAVVAGMTIVPNIDPTLLKGTPNLLLSITYIDDAFIADVGHSLLLSDLTLAPQAAKVDGIVSEAFVGDDGIPVGLSELDDQAAGPGAVDHQSCRWWHSACSPPRVLGEHDAAAASPHVGRVGRARGAGAARSQARCAFRTAQPRAHGREDRQLSCRAACLRPTTIAPSPPISMSIASRISTTRSVMTPATN